MTRLLLVRHADAGDRTTWQDDDATRPLTGRGRRQAEALVGLLAPLLDPAHDPLRHPSQVGASIGSAEVRSSPARRCVETIAPLAQELDVAVVEDEALFEGAHVRRLIDRLAGVAATGVPAVWSSHGDVIPAILMELARGGVDLGDEPRCRKGSTWVLDVGDGGRVSAVRYVERPD